MMDIVDYNYITSERFIHDGLIRKAEQILERLTDVWQEQRTLPRFMHAWCAEPILSDEGKKLDEVTLFLPEDPATHRELVLKLIERAKPYGLLSLELRENEIFAVFESMHGTKAWHYPLELHGDIRMVNKPRTSVDQEALGLLWQKKRASALLLLGPRRTRRIVVVVVVVLFGGLVRLLVGGLGLVLRRRRGRLRLDRGLGLGRPAARAPPP